MRHGEAVSLGMICAAQSSLLINKSETSAQVFKYTKLILQSYNLPVKITDLNLPKVPSSDILLENLVNDKKRTSQGNRFVLVPSLGASNISYIKDQQIIEKSFTPVLL